MANSNDLIRLLMRSIRQPDEIPQSATRDEQGRRMEASAVVACGLEVIISARRLFAFEVVGAIFFDSTRKDAASMNSAERNVVG